MRLVEKPDQIVSMELYRERIWPSVWIFIATALVIPATLLVFLPISLIAGIVISVFFYSTIIFILILSTPTIWVTADELIAGKAHIKLELIAESVSFNAKNSQLELGQRLDARAWLMIRGWVKTVVKITITDQADPTPYWLLSTRNPDQLVRALEVARTKLDENS